FSISASDRLVPSPSAEPQGDHAEQEADDHRLYGDVEPDARDRRRRAGPHDRRHIPEQAEDRADDEAYQEIQRLAGHAGLISQMVDVDDIIDVVSARRGPAVWTGTRSSKSRSGRAPTPRPARWRGRET